MYAINIWLLGVQPSVVHLAFVYLSPIQMNAFELQYQAQPLYNVNYEEAAALLRALQPL